MMARDDKSSKMILGDRLTRDRRIRQAKRLIHRALKAHQKAIVGIRRPEKSKTLSYQTLMKQAENLRGRGLVFPYLSSGIGRGALVELADGSIKYDMIGGIGVHYLGHSHRVFIKASLDAALSDTVMQGHLQQTPHSIRLMAKLLAWANVKGAKLAHCFLTSSGAMANENALKFGRPAGRILAFRHGFAGRSLATAQITDKPANRQGLPRVLPVDYVPFYDESHPMERTAEALRQLRAHIKRHPGRHAAMFFELIQGEGGFTPGSKPFFTALMTVCRQHRIAVVVDEIQTMGRTDHLFAFQHFGLDRFVDVLTLGKMAQVCATLYRSTYNPRPGLLSQTFTSSSSAILGALALLDELKRGSYFGQRGKVVKRFTYARNTIKTIAKKHPRWIKGPFGYGAMLVFTVFNGSKERTNQFLQSLFQNGVLAFIAGEDPYRVRMLVPVTVVSKHDLRVVGDIVERTLVECAIKSGTHSRPLMSSRLGRAKTK